MKKLIILFFIFFLIFSCSSNRENNHQLEIEIIESIKTGKLDEIPGLGFEENKMEMISKKFDDPQRAINSMKRALNEGYLPLLEDISKGKFSCLNERDILNKYKFADWETRNIGFANWPLRVEGALLLQQIEVQRYQILIMKLCNEKELRSFIEEKQNSLEKAMTALEKMTKEENWVD